MGSPSVSYFVPLRSTSGIHVDEDTALTFAAVFAATKAISETLAMLPWRVFAEDGERRTLQAGTNLDRVLHRRPNEDMTAFQFKEFQVACALLWGNGYAEIERSNAQEIIGLHPIHPNRVTPTRDDQDRLVYEVSDEMGGTTTIPARQMYHLRGPTRDGVVGRSVISLARESWGLGIASDQFASAFMGNGGTPSFVIRATEGAPEMNAEGAQNLLASFDRRHKGAKNAGKSAYLEKGFEIETVGVPQKDAQFIEQRKHSVVDVARWFRIPPHKIQSMEDATFSNIEQQAIEFVTDSIQPWAERMEQEADAKLVDNPRWITKMNLNGLMRGDSAARSEFYRTMFNIGVFSPNDIRRLEDENPVPGGDIRLVPLNMVSLERAAQEGSTDPAAAMREVLIEAHERMITKECRAVERASGKDKALDEWAAEFYDRHAAQMRDALLPGARALASIVGADEADRHVDAHVEQHVEAARRDVVDERWAVWPDCVTPRADALIQRIVGAAKKEVE